MRNFFLSLFILLAGASHAQTPVVVPDKAAAKLDKVLKQTQTAVVLGKKATTLPIEARPLTNRVLVQSTSDFLAITSNKPTKEAYLQSLDTNLARISPLVKALEDRQQVASFYQDLLDIVGVESSEGRLTAFVETVPTKAKK